MSEPIFSRRDFLRLSSMAALGATVAACTDYPALAELAAAEESGRLKIVGARYDLDSGTVEMLFN